MDNVVAWNDAGASTDISFSQSPVSDHGLNTSTPRRKMDLFEWPQLQDPFAIEPLPQDADVLDVPEWYYSPEQLFFEDSNNPNPRQSCSGASTQSGGSTEYTQSPSEAGTNDGNSSKAKSAGRPRYPLQSGRDTTMNRIQRRRTQNRNSQRIYRQRRMEERNTFEERAIIAEENARNLQVQLSGMNSVIASLRQQIQQLQTENVALRVGY